MAGGRVGSRELKTRLGTYLRRVREGATLVVTERGRPVAELRPMAPAAQTLEERLQDLEARGLVTLGSGRPLRNFKPVRVRGASLARAILEDRDDRT